MNAPAELNRSQFLGSSDMAAVLGVSPWKTRLDLYLEKIGQGKPDDPDKAKIFKRGKRMEPIVIDMLEEEKGFQVIARNRRYTDQEFPFLACEVDAEAMVDAEHVNLEIKTSHPFAAAKFGEEGTDEIPVEYAAQAMHSLMVTGRRRCIFGVLVGSDNLSTYEVLRDDETIAGMRARAVDFWQNHVLAGVPPEPMNLPDVYELFRRAPGRSIQANAEVLEWVQALKTAKSTVKGGEEVIEDLQYKIALAMLGAEAVLLDGKARPTDATPAGNHILKSGDKDLLTIRLQSATRIDSDAVRTKHPAVAEECSKTASFFTFNLSRKKS